jgi:hypothetical protein
MVDASRTLPIPIDTGRDRVATLDQLAAIPEEEIWLAKQKSKQTRRASRLDVQHFMRALGITTTDALRQVDHRAVIAWERMQREHEGAKAEVAVKRGLARCFPRRRRSIDICPPRGPRIPQAFDNGRLIPKTGRSRKVSAWRRAAAVRRNLPSAPICGYPAPTVSTGWVLGKADGPMRA